MSTKYYVAAALMAAALMAIEHRWSAARGERNYRFADTVNSISHFLGEMVLMVVLYLNVFFGYGLLRDAVGVFEPSPTSPITWIAGFVALDLVYWVGHRACHRVGALWALHAVHHQSREYNLAVGLRGPWLSALQIAPFMVPLAIAGFPTEVLFPLYAGHTVWKLCVHTRLVGKLGPLEWVLATPSLHRVHHGSNERYLDRNFGGVLNVWDRLFGTFQVEDEAPVFAGGTATLDPLRNNLDPWRELAAKARRAGGIGGWLRALALPPTWQPTAGAPPVEAEPPRESPALSRSARTYVLAQLAAVGAATLAFMTYGPALSLAARIFAGGWIVASLVCLNSMLDGNRGARRFEVARVALALVALVGWGVARVA